MEHIYTAKEIADILQNEGDKEMTLRKVRHYAEIGILPERILINGKKRFTQEHLDYLRALRTMKKTGESLDNIKATLSDLSGDNIRNIGSQMSYYSPQNLINNQTHEFNADISFTFSNNVSSSLKSEIISAVSTIINSKKGDSHQ